MTDNPDEVEFVFKLKQESMTKDLISDITEGKGYLIGISNITKKPTNQKATSYALLSTSLPTLKVTR